MYQKKKKIQKLFIIEIKLQKDHCYFYRFFFLKKNMYLNLFSNIQTQNSAFLKKKSIFSLKNN
jgi:hypothetical protein